MLRGHYERVVYDERFVASFVNEDMSDFVFGLRAGMFIRAEHLVAHDYVRYRLSGSISHGHECVPGKTCHTTTTATSSTASRSSYGNGCTAGARTACPGAGHAVGCRDRWSNRY